MFRCAILTLGVRLADALSVEHFCLFHGGLGLGITRRLFDLAGLDEGLQRRAMAARRFDIAGILRRRRLEVSP